MQVAMRTSPLEFVLRRILDFVVATIIHVSQRISLDEPLERFNVRHALAHAEYHVEVRAAHEETRKLRVLVVFVKLLEIVSRTGRHQ